MFETVSISNLEPCRIDDVVSVTQFNPVDNDITSLIATCLARNDVSTIMSAPSVGIPKKAIVIDQYYEFEGIKVVHDPIVIINPKIVGVTHTDRLNHVFDSLTLEYRTTSGNFVTQTFCKEEIAIIELCTALREIGVGISGTFGLSRKDPSDG